VRDEKRQPVGCACDPVRRLDGWVDAGCKLHGLHSWTGKPIRRTIDEEWDRLMDAAQQERLKTLRHETERSRGRGKGRR